MKETILEDTKTSNLYSNQTNKEMTFTQHLEELRQAIIISFSFILITTCICFYFNESLINWFTDPLLKNFPNIQIVFVSPGEAFSSTIRLSLLFGIIFSLPIILNRVYWFISPGLTKQEKIISLPVIIFSYILFLIGASFSYYLLLPFGIKFLIGFAPYNIKPMLSLASYVSFSSSLIIGTGLVFEMPILIFMLALLRIVNSTWLKNNRKYFFLISFIIGAIITPSVDIVSQSLLAIALYILYEISIFFVQLLDLSRKKNEIIGNKEY